MGLTASWSDYSMFSINELGLVLVQEQCLQETEIESLDQFKEVGEPAAKVTSAKTKIRRGWLYAFLAASLIIAFCAVTLCILCFCRMNKRKARSADIGADE